MIHVKKNLFLLFSILALIIKAQETKNINSNLRGNGMGFTQNRGQIVDMDQQLRPDILFVGDGGGAKIYIRKSGVSYMLSNANQIMSKVDSKVGEMEKHNNSQDFSKEKIKQDLYSKETVSVHRIDLDFINCNTNTFIETADRVEGYTNYFYAHCPAGITNVLSYNELTIKNIYNNIDVRYTGDIAKGLKYDIIVNPGGNTNNIQLHYTGMEKLYIENERLYIKTSLGEIEERIPKVYQTINGQITDVKTTYVLKDNQISFQIKQYNKNYPLIIDPWVTYYGGSGGEQYHGSVSIDHTGNSLFSGAAMNSSFPVSAGVVQTAFGGSIDGFIAKFTTTGVRVFSTYYGGSGDDYVLGTAIDATDNIIISGNTTSSNLPIFDPGAGAYTQAYAGSDAFIAKFNSSGTSILWSSFYGGSNFEEDTDVTVDGVDNIIMTGNTWSTNFPILSPYQPSHGGGLADAFVVKFNSGGVRQWATYYGGSSEDKGYGIDYDSSGNIFFGGVTGSTNFPVISAFLSVKPTASGTMCGFLAKLDGSTGFPIWSTFYGGSGSSTEIHAITIDGSDNVYACGSPCSNNGIATAGAFQTTHAGGGGFFGSDEGFVVKFNNSGTRQWGTYLGGNNYEELQGIDCDSNDNVIVSGETYSANFPVTSCAYKTAISGTENVFLTKFDPTGALICSGFFNSSSGNEHYEIYNTGLIGGGCLAVNGCYAYIIMSTALGNLPVTSGAFQGVLNSGSSDYGLVQLNLNNCGGISSSSNFSGTSTTVCVGQSVDYTSTTACFGTSATTYSWNFPGGTPATSTMQNPTGITYNTSGTYDVKLVVQAPCGKDSLIQPAYITVSSCGVLSASTIKTDVVCNGNNTGSATVTAISGTANYTYSWSNGASSITTSPSNTITSLLANTYTVTITDGAANTLITTVVITQPTALSAITLTVNNARCGNNNGAITLTTPTGGTGAYTYSWSNGATSQHINLLAPVSYTVTVTDANACTKTTSATIGTTLPPTITSVPGTNPLCSNGTGTATASATGGTGTLTYTWSNSSSGQTINNLTTGTYSVTVIDVSNCSSVSTTTITIPTVITLNTPQNTTATCGSSNGSATISASGGTGSFSYSWNNGITSQTANGLMAGTYSVTVTDANSCTGTTTVLINNSPSPTINSVATTSVSCNGLNTGSAVASASGGNGTLTYSWNNGTTGTTINNISAGNYIVTVTDASGCITQSNITITEAPAISVTTPSATNATCGNNNGTLTLTTPTGGTGAYTYSWSNGVTTQNVSSLTSATYSVTITDNNGCTKTTSAIVNNSSGGTVTLNVASAINCNGGTGSITVTATTSTSPYTYSWSNGASATTSSLQHTVGSLQSNTYTVTITDNNGCTATSTLNLTQPTAITFTTVNSYTTSCGTNNGGADVTATGGTGTLNYSWSTTTSGQTISSVSAGTYIVTISDANSCTSTTSVLINNNPSATINSVSTTTLSCNNSNDGAAVINASGGVGTLTYSWSNAAIGQTISNVNAGTYIVSVTDGSGCLIQSNVVITQPNAISSQSSNANSSTCGNTNGSASITATGGTGTNYTYNWSTGVSSVTSGQSAIGSLQSSTYYCTVTDQNNCSYVHTFVIGNKPSPVFTGSSPVITPADCKGNSSGQIDVLISSGTGPYTYSWSNGVSTITIAQNNTINNLPAGNYSLTITDNNGCLIDTALTLTEPNFVFTSTVTATSATCITGGTATATIAGGNTGNYTYSWSSGVSSSSGSTQDTQNNLPANNYTITITDTKGCTTISTTTINAPTLPTVTATEQTAATCNFSTGVAAAAVAGGSSPYTYSWSNGVSSITSSINNSITSLPASTYTVTITDSNGCTANSTTAITNSNGPTIASQNSTGTCAGQATGQVAVTVAGGSGPYTYSWSNGVTSTTINPTSQIANLTSGTYMLTITDANNCTATATALLPLFSNPIANAGTDQIITNGTSIQLIANGGTSYLWTPASTLNNVGISNPIANPTQTTTYTVIVTDANSCSSTDDITITVITPQTCNASEADEFVANVFTPNGDGRNDVLYVKGNGLTGIYFAIYNRWGQKLFETTDQTKGWNGTQNGKPIDEQTVVYYLTATCVTTGENIVKKGDISVVK